MKPPKINWIAGSAGQKHAYYGWIKNLCAYTLTRVKFSDHPLSEIATAAEHDLFFQAGETLEFKEICKKNDIGLSESVFIDSESYQTGTPGEKAALKRIKQRCAEDLELKWNKLHKNVSKIKPARIIE